MTATENNSSNGSGDTNKADYKYTLNLPKTNFAMKANLANREPNWLKKWHIEDYYGQVRAAKKGKKTFILHDGPPYANGNIHVGHAVNKILKDIIVKSKTLSGFDVPWVPGWDCHGLPIELNVEKKVGKAGVKISHTAFRKACQKYAAQQVSLQKEDFKRLGILADWENPYLTMDAHYTAEVIRTFARILNRGYVKKGARPVHWCCDCRSSLAEAEVEYKEKHSSAIDVMFALDDLAAWASALDVSVDLLTHASVLVWTTTPWTLPANQAVAYTDEDSVKYALIQIKGGDHLHMRGQVCILAEALLEPLLKRCDLTEDDVSILTTFEGKQMEGLSVKHPFYQYTVAMLLGAHVTVESGTGLVHTAPAHGIEDFQLGQRYDLPMENPVGSNGCFVKGTRYFEGQFVFKANEHVIALLSEKGRLLHAAKIEHSYPHCWRHKSPLIFRATPQWFIMMDANDLHAEVDAGIKSVDWQPSWGQARIESMMKGRPDWCISRQRIWGTPLPLFIHKETGVLHPDTGNLLEVIADCVSKKGTSAWFDAPDTDFLSSEALEDYERTTDILDIWFDSGASNAAVLRQPQDFPSLSALGAQAYPADLYLEGSDQHRGWFQTSMLVALSDRNDMPYRQVLTHGFAVDSNGRKMSKSIGNVVSPQEIVKTLGADVLRLWVASSEYRTEMTVSDEIFKRTSDVYRRIRNTARFLLSNLHGFTPSKDLVPFAQMIKLDQWAVDKTAQVQSQIIQAYDQYDFHRVVQLVQHFCAIEMGSFYLDVIKDRQYTVRAKTPAHHSAQTAMYHMVMALMYWISPILSFTAAEISQNVPEFEGNIFTGEWYDGLKTIENLEYMNRAFWGEVLELREQVNKQIENMRKAEHLGSSLEASVSIAVPKDLYDHLSLLGNELRFLLLTSEAVLKVSDTLKIEVQVLKRKKCARCWHYCEDIGEHGLEDGSYTDICGRCVENLTNEQGEIRKYA